MEWISLHSLKQNDCYFVRVEVLRTIGSFSVLQCSTQTRVRLSHLAEQQDDSYKKILAAKEEKGN